MVQRGRDVEPRVGTCELKFQFCHSPAVCLERFTSAPKRPDFMIYKIERKDLFN